MIGAMIFLAVCFLYLVYSLVFSPHHVLLLLARTTHTQRFWITLSVGFLMAATWIPVAFSLGESHGLNFCIHLMDTK